MKALSIRQPWAWLIVNGYKDIENRTWATKLRGTILVHASKGMTIKEYVECAKLARAQGITLPCFVDLQRGGIVGQVDIVECVTESDSPYFFSTHGFVLANAEPLPFQPMNGRLGFFDAEQSTSTPAD